MSFHRLSVFTNLHILLTSFYYIIMGRVSQGKDPTNNGDTAATLQQVIAGMKEQMKLFEKKMDPVLQLMEQS